MGEAQVCKLYKKVAYSHTGPKEAIFTRLRCKQWSCEFCAKKNASIWRAFLKDKLPQVSGEWWIMTLTAPPFARSKDASLKSIRDHFEMLLKRMKRVFGKISYVRVYEKHPTSQALHLHAIISGVSPFVAVGYSSKLRPMAIGVISRKGRNGVWAIRTWLKINAQACHMGNIADIELIEGDTIWAFMYVCKYLTKSQQDINVKGLRHVQTTRDIGSPKTGGDNTWHTAAYIIPQMFEPNTAIKDLNTGDVIDNNYWEEHTFYPYED